MSSFKSQVTHRHELWKSTLQLARGTLEEGLTRDATGGFGRCGVQVRSLCRCFGSPGSP